MERFITLLLGCLINGDGYELREWLGLAEDGQYEYGDAEVPMVDESARPACSPLRVADAEVPMVDESARPACSPLRVGDVAANPSARNVTPKPKKKNGKAVDTASLLQ